MRGEPGPLYDAHADRLYAYCWSLVGDDAAGALKDAFLAAVQHPPRGDAVLWLYALARTACGRRGALDRAFGASLGGSAAAGDPLLRAAAGLRADHREVLVLSAGEWLDVPDIARVLGVAPDTGRQLLHLARGRLERGVLDILLRGGAAPGYDDVIAAFEKGRLPQLLARRAPDRPPGALRADVLAAYEAEATSPLPTVASPAPLVVIGPAAGRGRPRPRRSKVVGGMAGLAASAAATAGLLVSWPALKGGDGPRENGAGALAPTTSETGPAPAGTRPNGAGGPASASPSARAGDPYAPDRPQSTRSKAPSPSGSPAAPPSTSAPPQAASKEPAGEPSTAASEPPALHPAGPSPSSPSPSAPSPSEPPKTQEPEPTKPPTESPDPGPTTGLPGLDDLLGR